MNRTRPLAGLTARLLVTMITLGLLALRIVAPASADTAPPPGEAAGSGSLAGTERVDEWDWTGTGICIAETKSIFALRGVGTYSGRTASGQPVVYRPEIAGGQTLYANGPLQVEVENTQTYYHGPYGTHGLSDSSCAPATADSPVPAEFRIFAPDHVYRLNGTGGQAPCVGHGSFSRGSMNDGDNWHAQWTLDSDCTVVGNAAGTPGTGTAAAGATHTHAGVHAPCNSGSCTDNIRVDYTQYLPFRGLHVGIGGPASASVGSPVTITAGVTNDGQSVANTTVTFSVAGPAPAGPPASTALTGADGTASFTFTAPSAGDYAVTASATVGANSASGTHSVHFSLPAPTITLDGPARGQTEENVTVIATVTDAGNPLPATSVNFAVAGSGPATPASGSATTDQNGKASFTFVASRAGNYTVTASSTVAGQDASATHATHLEINTFQRVGSLGFATGERRFDSAVMDPAGNYAYFGTSTSPARVVKVDLRTFQRMGALTLVSGEGFLASAVIDPVGNFAYFGTSGNPAEIVKVDLATFQRVGALTLDSGHASLRAAVIDPNGAYAYFGTSASNVPGGVVKVDLRTFQRVGDMTFEAGELGVQSAVIDQSGRFAYFGADGAAVNPGRVVKVDLTSFQRVGGLTLHGAQENYLRSAVIDPAGRYAYFGTAYAKPTHVVKVDLATFERAGAMTPTGNREALTAAVIDPAGTFAYFGSSPYAGPSTVVKINLKTFEEAYAMVFPTEEASGGDGAAVIDPEGKFAYFGADPPPPAVSPPIVDTTSPGWVVKLALSRPPVAWLVAANDTYSTPYASPLTVPVPGVLANDDDTQDNDPLTASLVKAPAHGDVTLNANGSFTYTPASGFSGTDTFTYSFDDGMNVSAPATVSITVGAAPAGVQAVSGGAFGFETNVSLFGGPATVKGGPGSTCGQTGQPACADGQSPAVALPPSGGDVAATDPDGNLGQYGPAFIFESHGPLTVRTQGATGPAGAVQSSASVKDISDNDPFHAGLPDGEASSTCTATRTTLGGSSRIVNGRLVTSTHPSTGDPVTEMTFPHDWSPAPNTEYRGTLNHVGDAWRIVFNEQILSPEAITVNAVHMYLLGPTAVGDMVIGQSRCGVVTAAANAAPVGNDDAYTATAGRPLVVPAAGVLANDTDADGQPLTAAKPAGTRPPATGGGNWTFPGEPAHGTLDLRPDGSFTYTPAPGYAGPDSFTYLAQDSRGKSDPATVSLTVAPATAKAVADFDGNGSTDLSVFRPNSGTWYLQGGPQANYGAPGDIAVPADYDGDGKSDVAVFRPSNGVWYVHGSAGTDTAVAFGASGDVPVPADYDGDAKADIAVFRNGVWYVKGSTGTDSAVAFGAGGDIPIPADYDGDGKVDRAVFRGGVWYVKGTAGTDSATAFGTTGDVPVPGDYDGNGTAEAAVFRPANGVWFVQGGAATAWGTNGDVPVPGDYDGNGDLELAVFRPSNGVWFVQGGATAAWGTTGDVPLPLPVAVYRSMS